MIWYIFILIVIGVMLYYIDSPEVTIAPAFKLALKVIGVLIAVYIVFCFISEFADIPVPHRRS